MALRWFEGWEVAQDSTTLARLYASYTGTVTPVDGASEDLGEAASSADILITTPVLVASPEDSWIIGIAFRADNTTSINASSVPFVSLRNSAGEQIRFEFVDVLTSRPSGQHYKIRVMRGVTELASSNEQFVLLGNDEQWVYFEFKVTIHDTTGSFSGRFSYLRKPSLGTTMPLTWTAANTNVDTKNQATAGADRFQLSMVTGNALNPVATDDWIVMDSTGAKNNDFIGPVLIEEQDVAGDGTTTQWTLAGSAASTEDAWNEPIGTAEDDKRLTSDVTTDIHLATVQPLAAFVSTSATTIVGVRHDIVGRMETTGDRDIEHYFRKTTGSPAQTAGGTALNVDSTTYEGGSAVLEDDPNTATDWDVADLNSYQYGVRNAG